MSSCADAFSRSIALDASSGLSRIWFAWPTWPGREALSAARCAQELDPLNHLDFAVVHSALGEMDRAFELLELGVRDHNGWIGCPRMPMFENFRTDPRYAEHLRRIGHPDAEWASSTR